MYSFSFLVDISIYKDEDQLKEIERRQKMEERKNKKKLKGRPKKSETASNNSTKDKAHKDDSSSDDEEDSSDEEDAKLSRSKKILSLVLTLTSCVLHHRGQLPLIPMEQSSLQLPTKYKTPLLDSLQNGHKVCMAK